jgi:hypothetical protein
MLTGYFDEGVREDLFTVICGFASTVDQWDSFEVDWTLFLASYGVPYFHMEEFAHSIGPFKKWKGSEAIRQKFISEAATVIHERVKAGFIFYVRHAAFKTVNSLFDVSSVWGSPYGLAGRCCIEIADDWRKGIFGSEEMKYIFEDGGPDKGGLIKSMTSIKLNFAIPSFEPGRDWKRSQQWPEGRKGLVQLQAADYLTVWRSIFPQPENP